MAEERKIPLCQLSPAANAAVQVAIIRDCLKKSVPKDATLANQYTEMPDGNLRIRVMRGETEISEIIVDKSQWRETKLQ